MWSKWECTDNDCCQYMRRHGNIFEMIQTVWMDTTETDRAEGYTPYIVVRDSINIETFEREEIEGYLASYQYSLENLREEYGDHMDWIIAECILEEEILHDAAVVADMETFEEAQKYIEEVVNQ